MEMDIVNELQKVSKLWPSKTGLATCLIIETLLIGLIFSQVFVNKNNLINLVILLLIYIFTILFWFYSNRYPKTKKRKFGFVVSIYCDDFETDKKFRADFIQNLKTQICDGSTGKYFCFIEINNHHAKTISGKEEARIILDKTKAHFIIYGTVKKRNTTHYFDLNSMVTHKPIPIFVSKELSNEMSELLPRKIKIEDDTFLENFEFTSKWAEIASKYLIGNVKLLSGDIEPAFDLYSEVLSISNSYQGQVIDSINLKSKNNIVLILDIKISGLYEKWVETHEISLFENIQLLIEEYKKFGIQNHQIETIQAIALVLLFQDIEKAIEILSKFPKHNRNATWLLNKAFLLASKGNLTAAYKEYKRALSRPVEEFYDGLINKVEDFIQKMIDQNSNFTQLHYCLGIINKEFKGDTILAKQDFENFISLTPIATFINEKEIANKWIAEMTKKAA